jgi:hypothetical protein
LLPGQEPVSRETAARDFVNDASSSLYSASDPYTNKTLLTANKLTVRYNDFAVVQNTADAGDALPTGVRIGTITKISLNLTSSGGEQNNAFALFGSITGKEGPEAALLGGAVFNLVGVDRDNTRVNGCLIGGGSCLVVAGATPNVNVFLRDPPAIESAEDIIFSFDPVLGSNNEALLVGAGAIDPLLSEDDCEADPTTPACRDQAPARDQE